MKQRAASILILAASLATVLFLGGCESSPLNAEQIQTLVSTPYPNGQEVTVADADMIVTQSRTEVTINNRTAHEYHNVAIWLNQQFVTRVKVIKIGSPELNTIPLAAFFDKNQEHFPIGGLLTPDKAFPVVSAELFDPAAGTKYRMIPR